MATTCALLAAVLLIAVLQISAADHNTQKPSIRISPYPLDIDGKIVNGTLAIMNNTMHQVSVRNKFRDGIFFGTGHLCGGSLIEPNVVLTAAHCIVDYSYTDKTNASFLTADQFVVVMGNLDRFNRENTLVFELLNITLYRKTFDLTTYDGDIALLFLNGSVPLNQTNIKPIEINRKPVADGTLCQVTGWGQTEDEPLTDFLRTVDVPLITRSTCVNQSDYGEMIHEGMMCAGYMEEGERDACQGDSGGPLVCNGKLAGAISWGSGCAVPYRPGVYTDLDYYQDWIDVQTGKAAASQLAATFATILLSVVGLLSRWLC